MRLALLLGSLALGCGGESVRLIVDVRTDLVPGIEFDEVRARSVEADERVGANEGDWIASHRVLDVRGLPRDSTRRVQVELLLDGAVVIETHATVDNRRDAGITLVITRDCRGVSCADDERCFGGRCANEACLDGTQASCPEPECASDADCPAPLQSCARARCAEGTCIEVDDRRCGDDALCDPDEGCVGEPLDAGMPDASIDVGVDAQDLDAGPPSDLELLVEADSLLVFDMARAPGGFVIVGEAQGMVDLPEMSVLLPTPTAIALFLQDDGDLRWLTSAGASALSSFRDVVVTSTGAYASGQFAGTTGVGSGRDAGSRQEPWIIALDLDSGAIESVRFFPASGGNAQGRAVSVSDGEVIAFGGLYAGDLQLVNALPASVDDQGFFGVLTTSGPILELPIEGGDNTAANATLSDAGRACVGGRFNGNLTFGSISAFTNPARSDALIACFDPSGTLRWSATYGGDEHDSVLDLRAGPSGEIYAGGYASAPLTLDGRPFTGFGAHDATVIRFDASGVAAWIASAGGPGVDEVQRVTSEAGRIVAVGRHGGSARFGETMIADPGAFVWELTSAGDTVRVVPIASSDGSAQARGIADDGGDGFVVAVEFSGTIDVNGRAFATTRRGVLITRVP